MKLTHPSAGVKKVYRVSVDRRITNADVDAFLAGIELADGTARFLTLTHIRDYEGSVVYEISVTEGRNRLIRRMFGARGYIIKRLVRTEIGRLGLKGMKSGEIRKLEKSEVDTIAGPGGKSATKRHFD